MEKSNDIDYEDGGVPYEYIGDEEVALPKKPVYCSLSDVQKETFRGKYFIEPITRGGDPHTHPFSAYERSALELQCVKMLRREFPSGRLVDVGSAAARVQKHDINIHAMVPILQPGDKMRAREAKYGHCNHILQECTCGPFMGALFTHNYYIPPMDLLLFHKRLVGRVSYHVVHTFNSVYGDLCEGESNYYFDGRNIVCKTNGNTHTYVHHLPIHQVEAPFDDEGALSVDVVKVLGDTCIVRCEYTYGLKPTVAAKTSNLKELVQQVSVMGEARFDAKGLLEAPQVIDVGYSTLNAYGPVLIAEGPRTAAIAISRSAVAIVASKLMGQPRSAALWANALFQSRALHSGSRVPAMMLSKMVLMTAALAFTVMVEEEANVLNHVQTHMDSLFRVHSLLVGFAPLSILPFKAALVVAAVFVAIGWVLFWAVPQYEHATSLLIWGLAFTSILVLVLLKCVADRRRRNVGSAWTEHLVASRGEETSVILDCTSVSSDGFGLPASLNFQKPRPLVVGSSSIDYRKNEQKSTDDKSLLAKIEHVGVAVDAVVPRVYIQSLESEMSGVTNRMILETPPIDGSALHRFQKWWYSNEQMSNFIHEEVHVNRKDVENWVMRYSMGRRRELLNTWDELQSRIMLTDREKETTAFVKIEKKMDTTPLGVVKPGIPRMVVAHSDACLVLTAPFISIMYRQILRCFNQYERLFFSPGSSSESVGCFFLRASGRCVNPLYVSGDAEKFDAHCKKDISQEWYRTIDFKGASDLEMQAFVEAGCVIRTPHGYTAKIPQEDKPLESGGSDTNSKGSLVTMGLVDSDPYVSKKLGGLATCGDDSGGVFDVSPGTENEFKHTLERNSLLLGFKETFIVSRNSWDLEFCSKLAWPINDELWVMGGKPGRMISRLGWLIIGPNEPNIRGVVIGLLNDNWFVPILGTLLRRLYALTSNMKAKFGKGNWDDMHVSKRYEPTSLTYNFFFSRYNTTEQEMLDLEQIIEGIERLPCIINHPLLLRMIERDEE